MCHLLGIKKSRTTTYHAQSDGLVERLNRTLLQILRVMAGERQDDWDEALPYAISADTPGMKAPAFHPSS